jgi:tetratricopeptide (TPR) repeat protein
MKVRLHVLLRIALVVCMMSLVVGCDNDAFKSNLEKGDKYYAAGDYQTALKWYLAAAQEYQDKLGKTYSSEDAAKQDAMKLVESYLKSGLTHEKLNDPGAAKAMFQRAATDSYNITEGYYVKEDVWIAPGNQQVWVPGFYQDVWVDGVYNKTWVDGYYETKQTWVDGYYKSDGTYVNGYYKDSQVWHEGYYKDVFVEGHYEKKFIDGHYETKWVAGHYESKDIYKTKIVKINIQSPYIDQAKSRLGTTVKTQETLPQVTDNSPAVKAAYDKMTASYEAWKAAGMLPQGKEFTEFQSAKQAYEKLVKQ